MTLSSFAGALTLGLAASTVRTTRAAPGGSGDLPDLGFNPKKAGPSGGIGIGSATGAKKTITNKIRCGGVVNAEVWSSAASAYVSAVKKAVIHGCKGDIKFMTETLEGEAKAYAKIALDTKSRCRGSGAGVNGCSFTEGSAMAHAQAVYDIFAEAFASASNKECGCAAGAISATYATAAQWDKLFASAMGTVETKVCQSGTGTNSAEASVECYASAVAKLTAKAAAGAWLQTKVNGKSIDGDKKVCGPEDMVVSCTPDKNAAECQADAYARAKTHAKVIIDIDETSIDDCKMKYSDKINADATGSTIVSNDQDFTAKVDCIGKAESTAVATAINTFVDTSVYATQEGCKKGVDSYKDAGEGVGKAFAQAWVDTKARCKVQDGGTDAAKGCAYVEAFAKTFAKGAAESWVIAEADAAFEGCKCKAAASAKESVEAFFSAELFAEIMLTAGGDIWGENCVSDGTVVVKTELDCMASAMAAFWNKAHAAARIKGQCLLKDKAVCEHVKGPEMEKCYVDNSLRVSAFAEALVKTDIEFNDGFCTGSNQGGFYYFDALTGGYNCVKGC